MVQAKKQVVGLASLQGQLRRVAKAVSPQGHLSDVLDSGAEVILEEARQNILNLGLWQSGDLYDSGKVRKINQYRVDIIFDVVYAAIHEWGGTIEVPVTKASRGYFWWRYRVTGDPKWRAMALSKKTKFIVRIPARPYIRPAIVNAQVEATKMMARTLSKIVGKAL